MDSKCFIEASQNGEFCGTTTTSVVQTTVSTNASSISVPPTPRFSINLPELVGADIPGNDIVVLPATGVGIDLLTLIVVGVVLLIVGVSLWGLARRLRS